MQTTRQLPPAPASSRQLHSASCTNPASSYCCSLYPHPRLSPTDSLVCAVRARVRAFSWGTYWGEHGWFKLQRGTNNFGVEGWCSAGVPVPTW